MDESKCGIPAFRHTYPVPVVAKNGTGGTAILNYHRTYRKTKTYRNGESCHTQETKLRTAGTVVPKCRIPGTKEYRGKKNRAVLSFDRYQEGPCFPATMNLALTKRGGVKEEYKKHLWCAGGLERDM